MTAVTQYQGGGDPFSDPSGSTDPSPFGDPSMYSNPGEGGDPYGVMDPFMGGSDPLADPYGGGGGVDGISIQTYQGLFQVNGGLYSDPFGGMDPTMVGGSDPYSDPFGGSDPEFNGTAGRVRLRLPYTPY